MGGAAVSRPRFSVLSRGCRSLVTAVPWKLHDATFVGFEFAWELGELRILLRKFDLEEKLIKDAAIVCRGVTVLRCDRHMPWGVSTSINRVVSDQEDGIEWIEVEMQTGDLIRVEAASFSFEYC